MRATQQIRIEQVPIGELRPDPAMKRTEELNRVGIGKPVSLSTTLEPKPSVPLDFPASEMTRRGRVSWQNFQTILTYTEVL